MFKPHNVADVAFDLQREIGAEGRNSQVYVAHDPQLDAKLVIKKIAKAQLDTAGYFSESACIYASAHSNVVPIHYACQDSDFIYLAMPHYAKGSLKALMSQRFLTVREIVVLATQFLSGLHNIHSKRLVHFDITTEEAHRLKRILEKILFIEPSLRRHISKAFAALMALIGLEAWLESA
jgi:serine/threonine protein kinase